MDVKTRLRKRKRTGDEASHSPPATPGDHDDMENSEQLAHECGICKKVYSREYKLSQHERLVHYIKVERQCSVCMTPCELSSGEIDKTPQRHHIVFSSTGKASHQCTVCLGLLSSCVQNAIHQSEKHNETDIPIKMGFQCAGCSRIFTAKNSLKRHTAYACPAQDMSNILGMKFRCQLCYELAPNEKCWKRHLESHRLAQQMTAAATTMTTSTTPTETISTNV